MRNRFYPKYFLQLSDGVGWNGSRNHNYIIDGFLAVIIYRYTDTYRTDANSRDFELAVFIALIFHVQRNGWCKQSARFWRYLNRSEKSAWNVGKKLLLLRKLWKTMKPFLRIEQILEVIYKRINANQSAGLVWWWTKVFNALVQTKGWFLVRVPNDLITIAIKLIKMAL